MVIIITVESTFVSLQPKLEREPTLYKGSPLKERLVTKIAQAMRYQEQYG